MKKRITALVVTIAVLLTASPVLAGDVYVNGYYKSNGTYVQPYVRSSPDNSPYNNYSYPGNYNPNTNSTTRGSESKYLDNYTGKGSSYSSSGSYRGYGNYGNRGSSYDTWK